jgi:hypothetical protein
LINALISTVRTGNGYVTHYELQMIQLVDAIALSGLTGYQLREWCGRRAVVVPDVPSGGRGRHALYSWQTILALRVLKEVHDTFGAEVSSWRVGIAALQEKLKGRSFPSLWGSSVAFFSRLDAALISPTAQLADSACLLIPLDPHLEVLASGLALPGSSGQLPLFAAMRIGR